ncbi:MAG: Lipoprotein-releasing system ATP-binding protein LolD [Phycisphaerae bacterium]|nr:Lipoprotein-releasing system ATP-binding protein LolD [Phycisphaerae bacterium]
MLVRQLAKTYRLGRVDVDVLRGVDLSVKAGEFVAIIGASGSGKSTLLHLMGLLDRPTEGSVSFRGQDIHRLSARRRNHLRNRAFGFVFQFYHLLPELRIVDNVLLPAMVSSSTLGWFSHRRRLRAAAVESLTLLGLGHRLGHRPAELSGGERQRVAIARALVNSPEVLLADEPTGNLDATSGSAILDVLATLNKERGQTVVMVTHDPKVAAYAHRTVELRDGRLRAATG